MAETITMENGLSYVEMTDENDKSYIQVVGYKGTDEMFEVPFNIEGKPVKVIGAKAFRSSTVQMLLLPSTVEEIGDEAFGNCISLKEVMLTGNLKRIGKSAFYGCSSLETLELSEGLESIGGCAFECCTSLKQINIPSTVTNIDYEAFEYCMSLEEITLPENLKSINYGIFSGCLSLKTITIPKSVELISFKAFENCTMLEKVVLPESVKKIENFAFKGCTNLKSINFGKVEEIKYQAFMNCVALKTVVLPDTVTLIGNYALGFFEVDTEKLENTEDDEETTVNRPYDINILGGKAAKQYAIANNLSFGFIGIDDEDLETTGNFNNRPVGLLEAIEITEDMKAGLELKARNLIEKKMAELHRQFLGLEDEDEIVDEEFEAIRAKVRELRAKLEVENVLGKSVEKKQSIGYIDVDAIEREAEKRALEPVVTETVTKPVSETVVQEVQRKEGVLEYNPMDTGEVMENMFEETAEEAKKSVNEIVAWLIATKEDEEKRRREGTYGTAGGIAFV